MTHKVKETTDTFGTTDVAMWYPWSCLTWVSPLVSAGASAAGAAAAAAALDRSFISRCFRFEAAACSASGTMTSGTTVAVKGTKCLGASYN